MKLALLGIKFAVEDSFDRHVDRTVLLSHLAIYAACTTCAIDLLWPVLCQNVVHLPFCMALKHEPMELPILLLVGEFTASPVAKKC